MPPFSGMRCLVVDDEPRLRRVLVRLLEGEGFACAEAGSGVEALKELEKAPVPLVISDLRMPEMDGVTLLRVIIEHRNYQAGLEERVEAQARRIEELFLEGVHALVFALEAKDAYTRGHSMRVANYSVEIARALGLDKDLMDTIALGAELHEIGRAHV